MERYSGAGMSQLLHKLLRNINTTIHYFYSSNNEQWKTTTGSADDLWRWFLSLDVICMQHKKCDTIRTLVKFSEMVKQGVLRGSFGAEGDPTSDALTQLFWRLKNWTPYSLYWLPAPWALGAGFWRQSLSNLWAQVELLFAIRNNSRKIHSRELFDLTDAVIKRI